MAALSRVIDRVLAYCAAAAIASAAIATVLAVSRRQPADYRPGDRFPPVVGFDVSRAPATIVVFLHTNCGACQRSAEVFRRLAQRPRPFQVVVMGYQDERSLRQFVDASAMEADAVLSVSSGTLRFAAVPRLALLDRRGVIKSVWAGSESIADLEVTILVFARALGEAGEP